MTDGINPATGAQTLITIDDKTDAILRIDALVMAADIMFREQFERVPQSMHREFDAVATLLKMARDEMARLMENARA